MYIRKSFAKIGAALPFPDLLENQKRSFEQLLQADLSPDGREDVGIQSAFQRAFPIRDIHLTQPK